MHLKPPYPIFFFMLRLNVGLVTYVIGLNNLDFVSIEVFAVQPLILILCIWIMDLWCPYNVSTNNGCHYLLMTNLEPLAVIFLLTSLKFMRSSNSL